MNKNLKRLLNASILLGAITFGARAVEHHDLWLCALALLFTYSYTLFTKD